MNMVGIDKSKRVVRRLLLLSSGEKGGVSE